MVFVYVYIKFIIIGGEKNKHTGKHIVKHTGETRNKQTYRDPQTCEAYRDLLWVLRGRRIVSFLAPCSRLSPD